MYYVIIRFILINCKIYSSFCPCFSDCEAKIPTMPTTKNSALNDSERCFQLQKAGRRLNSQDRHIARRDAAQQTSRFYPPAHKARTLSRRARIQTRHTARQTPRRGLSHPIKFKTERTARFGSKTHRNFHAKKVPAKVRKTTRSMLRFRSRRPRVRPVLWRQLDVISIGLRWRLLGAAFCGAL